MKKTLIIIGSIFILLIAFVAAAPFIFKNKIITVLKEQTNQNLNATINFDNDIDISILKSFPNLTLAIHNLSVVGIKNFANDTLFYAKKSALTLDIMSVIKGDVIAISKITLVEPNIHAIISADGKANWDIAKPSTDTVAVTEEPTNFNVKLKLFEVINGQLVYEDKEGNITSELKSINYKLEGDFTQDLFTLNNKLTANNFTVIMDGITYLSKTDLVADALIDADMPNMKFTFKENTFSLNNLIFGFDGIVTMPTDDITMDIKFNAKQNDFKNFLSLIPAIYASDLSKLQTKGKLDFNGFAKGVYNVKTMPAFGLNLNIVDGWFKYTDMPAPLENVMVNLSVTNPDGDLDNTVVDFKTIAFKLQNNPFNMHLKVVSPISDPNIDFAANGKLDFTQISKLVPLPTGTEISGLLTTDIFAKGKVSSLENQKYQEFNAGGTLLVSNMLYNSSDLPKPFKLQIADVNLTPKVFNLNAFKANIGESDFDINGTVSNFIPYYFNDGTLQATLNFKSNTLNANQFLAEEDANAETVANDTAALTVFEVPKNVNITFNSHITKLLYTNMEIDNFKGTVTVKNQQINFNQIALNTIGSTIKMDGFYNTVSVAEPKVAIDFSIANMDFQKAFKTFNTIKKLAPAAENIFGEFSTTFNLQTNLTQNMQPNYASLFANGILNIPHAEVKNINAINKIADALQKPEFKSAGFNNAKIDFKVENGRITTKPFDMKLAGKVINIGGSTGIDQTIDYIGNMSFQRSELGAANTVLNAGLEKLNKQLGSSIKPSDVIPVGITIGGTFLQPKIGTNIGEAAKNEVKSIANQIGDEVNKKKAELEAQAKAEADRLKKEAQDKANQLKAAAEAKAKAEADRLKKEAEDKANAEKERLKKKAEEEAKKKLKGLF